MRTVFVTGSFDNIGSRDMRFLEEAAKLGPLIVRLWSDATFERLEGRRPNFPLDERLYILNAIRYVNCVEVCPDEIVEPDNLPCLSGIRPDTWVVDGSTDSPSKRAYCAANGIDYVVISEAALRQFPTWTPVEKDFRVDRK